MVGTPDSRSRMTGTRRSHPLQVPDQESPLWLPSIANPNGTTRSLTNAKATLPKVSGVPTPGGCHPRTRDLFRADDMVQAAGTYKSPTTKRKSKYLTGQRDSVLPKLISAPRTQGVKLPALSQSRGGSNPGTPDKSTALDRRPLSSGSATSHSGSPTSSSPHNSNDQDEPMAEEATELNLDDIVYEYDADHIPGVETDEALLSCWAPILDWTGDDVVNFYAKYGQDSAVKFFYCQPAETGLLHRPYELRVVDKTQAGAEYYTISATGVMKVQRGIQAEFIALGDFMREKTLFELLVCIKFYKYFMVNKCFQKWHKDVRRKLFRRVRAKIVNRLFMAKPSFCPSLMEIHNYVYEVSQIQIMKASQTHLYTLQEYADGQTGQREQKAKPTLDNLVEKIQNALENVCKSAQKQARLYQESIRDMSELEDTTGVELYQGKTGDKHRGMADIRQDKVDRARTYRRVMEEAARLGEFIRLVDYMLVESTVDMAVSAVSETLKLLVAPRLEENQKTTKGVFTTTVGFLDTGNSFTPDKEAVLDVLNENVIEGAVAVAQACPRLMFMRAFSTYYDHKPSSLNAVPIIRDTKEFQDLRQQIGEIVNEDFDGAAKYAKLFDEHRRVYKHQKTWNFDNYKAKEHSLREIKRDMMKMREWLRDLEKMKISTVNGSLYVDSKTLRNELLPITQSTLDQIKGMLLGMARASCLDSLTTLQDYIRALNERPEELDEFMNYQVFHTQQAADKVEIVKKASVVDDMYELLAIYEQKVPTSDQVKHDDLKEAAAQYLEALKAGKEFMADHKVEMISTLELSVTDMNEELMVMLATLSTGTYVDPEADAEEVVQLLEEHRARLKELHEMSAQFLEYQNLFGLSQDDFSNLELADSQCDARYQVWKGLFDFTMQAQDWTMGAVLMPGSAPRLNIEHIRKEVDEYATKAYKMGKAAKDDLVISRLKDTIEDFKEVMPLVEEVANPALKDRHWDGIFKAIGFKVEHDEEGNWDEFSVTDLIGSKILDKLEMVQTISASASKEYSLEKALEKMRGDWEGVEFRCIEYKDTGTFIIGGTDEIQAILDDQIVKTQSMCASPFIKALEKEATVWNDLLNTLQDMLDNWLTCQGVWQYLEPIFSSPDIMKQMPEEGEKFQQVDQMWREMMEEASKTPACLIIAQDKARLKMLQECNSLLDDIQKGLAAYLEVKRLAFPRFFFLSNDEMLEILSETKDPLRVQPHLKKCFEGINVLDFNDKVQIVGMVSAEGEKVPMHTIIDPAKANGAVEMWLIQVEAGMLESVQYQTKLGMAAYAASKRVDWVLEWPGQVVLVVSAAFWTQQVTKALESGKEGALKEVAESNTADLLDIVNLVRGELTKMNRATLSALVVMDVHARDTVVHLSTLGIEGQPSDFSWLSQLRMYWEDLHDDPENFSVMIRMMNAEVEYGYEYLGNSSRLVVTPLTDRCYRTLIGAIHLNLGGAPEGPAGTGKTETTKDLAKALARQCVVFNCSDTLDYLTMAKFFKGLAASGAWACFDEFNRIDLEVLSVVAQQVLEIQIAVKNKVETFWFEGSELRLRPSCNAFITMNPGYAGRSELPDNLKALFRTVAMMVPDYAMISEIILYSNGYLKARDSARKIVATYKLCSEQLSSQDHYDYGMRAVIAVLRAAGNLKRKFPDEDEFVLMLRSIIDVNLCKFLSHDVPLFNGIVSDLFPGVVLPEPDYNDLNGAMIKQCSLMNLQPTDYFLLKTIQLYEMIVVRHGLMIVGESFSGKSCSLKVLAGALTDLHDRGVEGTLFNRIQCRFTNPKSVTMGQLYGENDKATQEWKDGVLAISFRQLASDPSEDRKWCVLDGPVDAIWIENMNTVLDDNKKLCLPNSEIIGMSPTMSMIFEVGDLAAASPATVSRCGMVYLEPHQLGWKPLLTSWINTLTASCPALGKSSCERLKRLFLWLLPPGLRFVEKQVQEISPTSPTNLAQTAMRLVESMLAPYFRSLPAPEVAEGEEPAEAPLPSGAGFNEAVKEVWVDSIFLFSLVWSVGITGPREARAKFDQFLRGLVVGVHDEDYNAFIDTSMTVPIACPIIPDDNGTNVYDWTFDTSAGADGTWKLWVDTLDKLVIPAGSQFNDIIVPTLDSARYTFMLDTAVKNNYSLLMVGPTGTGKSAYINTHLVKGLSSDKYLPIFITLSARTGANMVQEQVDGRLDKRKKGVYGPSVGKTAIIFVDDLNMPTKEVYGAQPPIELLRQFQDYSGWYGRDNVWRAMIDTQFVAAMGPPGGGRAFVTPRYLRHFSVVGLSEVEDSTLVYIFSTILNWHMANGFAEPITALSPKLINATLAIYSRSIQSLLPTPSKSHYIFNLRDFARVTQGIMLAPASGFTGDDAEQKMKRLWVHECFRVFYDRLVDDKDRMWLLDALKKIINEQFADEFDGVMGSLDTAEKGYVDLEDMRRCFFGDFIQNDKEPEDRTYNEVTDIPAAISILEEYLVDHNGMSKRPMNLAIFLYAAEHISRVCRLLKQPGGNMLLAGVGGSGRQSLSRLAAFIMGMEVFQVEISKSYTKVEWREDLKSILKKSGGEGKETVFLFSDTQIKEESFVEDINNLLNSGEVPNLFPMDERLQVMEQVRTRAGKLGLETPLELWAYFISECRKKLHTVLCFSPIGDAFRDRLRQNPALVNCCTIDWFQTWPTDALEAVAYKFLREMDLKEEERKKLVTMCQSFHKKVRDMSEEFLSELGRHNYVTPTSYLELISLFQTLLNARRQDNKKMTSRYVVGLEKLASSSEQVAQMQDELTALQPQLKQTMVEVEDLMKVIDKEKKEVVEPKAAIVAVDEAAAQKKAEAAKAIKDECEAGLAEAMPILNEALSALDTIKEADINYIKKLGNPPATIKLVLEAVCVILDVKPAKGKDDSGKPMLDYWKPSIVIMSDKNFVQNLKSFDKDNINPKLINIIREKYLTNESFTPENAKKASSAAEGLCKWVHAMSKYDKVAKVVAPKKAMLAEAEGEYEEVMKGLRGKQAELKELMDKLQHMEDELNANKDKKDKLQAEVDLCGQKLERAEKLIGGLGGEKSRWTDTAENLRKAYSNLTGDMVVAAGVIAYLGAFTADFRDRIVESFISVLKSENIAHSPKFSLNAVLGEPVKVREWLIAGLPNDSFSIDNGIMVANARRWPLMIDPQNQANKWIKNLERSANLQVIKLSDGGEYIRVLENAIQFGLPVLLENVGEELDPSLEPLLLKQIFKSGGVNCIRLGDSTIEYSEDFRFYITSKLRNPHYLPEVAVKVTLLNFMITMFGLSDQMLGVTVAAERPDLEEQRNELVVQSAANNKKLKEIEDKILEVLSSGEGNILEDETAIQIITEAKVLGNDIAEKQKLAEVTEKNIDEARSSYKPCGDYTAVLFFCIKDLANIDPMYQYSLPWFVNLFLKSCEAAEKSDDVATRLDMIYDHFTYSLYCNVCRSLCEKDKLLFAFLLTARIMGSRGLVDEEEWMFLLTGGLSDPGNIPNPAPDWLQPRAWQELCKLGSLPAFKGLSGIFSKNPRGWQPLHASGEPHKEAFPSPFQSLDPFKKILIVRCIRPDKVVPAVQDYVIESLGRRFVEPPPFNLHHCYADSSPVTPLIFVLTPGSDPTAALLQFAAEKEMDSRLQAISLGQGQGPKAEVMINEGIEQGKWVVLQNCHLAPSWMAALDRICEDLNPDTTHADFRLWMTSYPSPKFPVNVLQNSVKMTNEPPKGIRANMRRSYLLEPMCNDEFFEGCNKPEAFKKLLFGFIFFHAVIQERRKFGPLGWNIPYGFDDGDQRISIRQLQMFINENEVIPFDALRYVTGECNYGGRVTDDKDRLLLSTILEKCCCPDVVDDPMYKLSSSGLYVAPDAGDHNSCLEYLTGLPIMPMPEAFGLHENADITKDQNDTNLLFKSLLSAGGGGGGGGSGGVEDRIAEAVRGCLAKLPEDFNIEKVQNKYPVMYEESMNTVLVQEMLRFNKLIGRIRESLQNINLAIDGLVVMGADLEAAYNSIGINEVPALWKGASYPSLRPLGSYLQDLYRRLKMLQDWYEEGIPAIHWLPGFFFTPSFLTAALQNYARKHTIPIDEVGYDFEVMDMNPDAYIMGPAEGIYIYGLYVEGCGWDPVRKVLAESKPKVLYVDAPCLYLKPMRTTEFKQEPHYNCPLYRTLERRGVLATTGHSTNFVMFVRIPTTEPQSHWIMRGVAMICGLSD